MTTKTDMTAAMERFEHDEAAFAEALAEAMKIAKKKRSPNAFWKALQRRPDLMAAITRDVVRHWIDEAVNSGELKLDRPN